MKYITCEGCFNIVYGYHFRLLTELRHKMDLPTKQKLRIPYFLLQSLIECGTKLKEGTHELDGPSWAYQAYSRRFPPYLHCSPLLGDFPQYA